MKIAGYEERFIDTWREKIEALRLPPGLGLTISMQTGKLIEFRPGEFNMLLDAALRGFGENDKEAQR